MSEKRKKRILRLCLVFLVLLSASIAFLLPRPMNEPQDNTVAVNDGHGTIRIEPIPGLPASTLRRSEFTHRDNAITYTGMEYTACQGVDVSDWQNEIRWQEVADSGIDFAAADDEVREIDVRKDEGGLPKVFKMKTAEQRYFKEYFNSLPPESRVRQCKELMFKQLNKLNGVDAAELKAYIERIVGNMSRDQLSAMEKAPYAYAKKIREKVDYLLAEHCRKTFFEWLQTERIVCLPSFRLPTSIHPVASTNIYGKSLYQAEEGGMNGLESELVIELTALPNVRWWHRNISRQGFCINGVINHYPDIIICTEKGKMI